MKTASTPIDQKTALLKAESWCAYQERSQQEVRNRLYEWGLTTPVVEQLIAELIATNFLSEVRFAHAYTSGKFSIKKWGKLKIKQGLKLKQVPDKLIQAALKAIDAEAYYQTLVGLAEKKSALLTENNPIKKKQRVVTYLQGKGFENDLIFDVLKANNLP